MTTKESKWRLSLRKTGAFFVGIKFLPTLEYFGGIVASIASLVEGILNKPTGWDILWLIIKWAIIGALASLIPYALSKAIGFTLVWASNYRPKFLPIKIKPPSFLKRNLPIVYKAVIVPNENMWGQKMPTYAGIRIDGEETCKGIKAKLKSIIRMKNSGEREPLDLDKINPTNQFLRWNEKAKCMLEIVDDWSDEPRILFQDMRYYKLNSGLYELCIEVSKPNSKPYEIKETLELRKPYSRVEMKWK